MSALQAHTLAALRSQAAALLRAGRLAEAERSLHEVMRVFPQDREARHLLGLVALQAGNAEAAVGLLLPEADARHDDAAAQYNAGLALALAQRFGEAATHFRRAVAIDPRMGAAWNNLGNILKAFGEIDEATRCFDRGMDFSPSDAVRQSHHLICAHYSAGFTHEQIFALHRKWAERYAAPNYPRNSAYTIAPEPERALNLGFVSPSFNGRIVGQFLRSVLPALSAQGFRLTAYSNTVDTDAVTSELRAGVAVWHDIVGRSDDAVARQIRADGIDILVDLAGHAPGNRLLVFARKPAPLQVTWLDYFDTTGLDTIDYFLTDPRTTPPDSPQRFSERILRLPETRFCWAPPGFAPAVAPLPAIERGHVTFGSFNRADKLNPELIAWWAKILHGVPDSRLRLKAQAFEMAEVRKHFIERLGEHGIAAERLEWRGSSSHAELLAEYAEVDIALDTHPYNGGATTCDALWMGVPVVALRGERIIARQSAAMLDCVGLGEYVAEMPGQYVDIAIARAHDPGSLAKLRQNLRPAMAASALCDAPRFARDFGATLRQIWRQWCAQSVANKELTHARQ